MMSLHLLEPRMKRQLATIMDGKLLNACPITMHYIAAVATAPGFDRNDESTYPSRTPLTAQLTGLVHWVSARTTQQQFGEIKAGDAIVSFEASVDFSGKDSITFEMVGPDGGTEMWVQAAVGKDLTQYWDVAIGGVPISQTIVLRKAT